MHRPAPIVHVLVTLAAIAAVISPVRAAGLLAPTDQSLPPLRVTDHIVDASVHDGVAITKVAQTFRNDTKQRLEATYVFPLPEDADLTDFQMSFNGKMVQGKVLPAEEARAIYESIVRQSKDPGLIEFIGRRLLQMRVFPIEPESDTRIELRYQQVCRPVGGMIGYHYPLRTRKTAGQAYGTVRFAVELETSVPLKNVWSPTHAVEIVRGGENKARIAYEAAGGSLEDDFVLLYQTDASDLGLSVVAYKPSKDQAGHFVLMLTPKQLWPQQDEQPQDVVFVIDTSGSMAGDKMDQAKAALKFCVDNLAERDRFSVVRFSTGFDVLFEELQAATKEKRAEARTWIDQFRAAGGTNIDDAMLHVFAMKPAAGEGSARPFVVVFLTDGRGNREADVTMNVLAEKGAPEGTRVFPFGVGYDVSTKLLDRLAADYHGRTTYVQPGENLELVLGDFFAVISRPVLTDLRLVLPEIGATERFPATLGDLYHGQQIVVAGKFATETAGAVRLTAKRGGETVEYAWPDVSFTSTDRAVYVPVVWAGRKIAYLIDQIRTSGESTEMVEEILALSATYGIQTPYSSWLVNPEGAPQPIILRHSLRVPPGARGAGGGFGGGQEGEAYRGAPASAGRIGEAAGETLFIDGQDIAFLTFGDEFADIDLDAAAKAVTEESGSSANLIARKNAELRDMRSVEGKKLAFEAMPWVTIEGTWYNRLGRYLVDERIGEKTQITVIRFASPAYFELAAKKPALRTILAAQTTVAVLVDAAGDRAVLVSDRVGIEALSDEQRNELGLGAGS